MLIRKAGAGFGISIFSMPAIIRYGPSTEVLVRQWKVVFDRGSVVFPALAGCTALNYFVVAQQHWSRGLEWRGFAAGGALQLAIIPFTILFIVGVNAKLMAAIDPKKETGLSVDAAKTLLWRGNKLHAARTGVALVGTVAALWNLLAVRGG